MLVLFLAYYAGDAAHDCCCLYDHSLGRRHSAALDSMVLWHVLPPAAFGVATVPHHARP